MPSFLDALQLALGSAGAGAGGYLKAAAQRDEEERLKREEARRLAAEQKALERQQQMDARQAEMDAATLRAEQRQAVAAGMVQADQYQPTGIAGGRDMPGATPRQPVFRQTIGGQEFVLPESPTVTKHRETMMQRALKQADQVPYQWSDKYGVFLDRRTGRVVSPEDLPGPAPRSERGAAGGGAAKPKSSSDASLAKEAQGMAFLDANRMNPAIISALNSIFTDNPALADRPGLAGYGIMMKMRGGKGGQAGGGAGGGRAPGAPPPSAGGATPAVVPTAPPASAKRDPLDLMYDQYTSQLR